MPQLPAEVDIVIIGGGVIGTAIAHELSIRGSDRVLLLESGQLGGGSSSRAAGGIRAQFSDDINIRLGLRGLEVFETFAERFGQEIDLHQPGYLFLIHDPDDLAAFEANVARQNALGVASRILSPAEALALAPAASPDGLLGAAFHSRDGHCTPEAVVAGYAAAARRAGTPLITGCPVIGIDSAEPGRRTVRTPLGEVRTETVVCAAGAWSAEIGEMLGLDLPVEPLRRQILTTAPMPGLDPGLPFTIDFASGAYFHREGPGLLIGSPEEAPHHGFEISRTDDWVAHVAELVAERFPGLEDIEVASGWAGLYEMTPDANGLIGSQTDDDGFRMHYATGFSGHGFLMGPGVSEVIADLHAERVPEFDVSSLCADRFAVGATRPERNIV